MNRIDVSKVAFRISRKMQPQGTGRT
jgi:hypothetical protein